MKTSALSLVGVLALGACNTPEEPKKAPAPIPARQELNAGYPESTLMGQTFEFKKPEGLTAMTQEEFEALVDGLSSQFARGYKEHQARPLEERKDKKNMNQLIMSFCQFLSKRSQNKIDSYFEATFPRGTKVELQDVVKFLNQFLHADDSHLRLRLEDGVWSVDQYQFSGTDQIEVHDKLGSGTYPILHITANLTGELPPHTLAEGDITDNLVQFYVNDQEKTTARLSREVSTLPGMVPPQNLGTELTNDTLHHEAAHLLLIDREREVNLYQGCVQARVNADIQGYGTLHLDGCFTARQVQELCGYSAELAATNGAGKWTLLDRLDDDISDQAPDYLFVRLSQPYTIDLLTQSSRESIMFQLRETGGLSTVDLKNFAATDLSAADVQAIGRRGYDECQRLTAELRKVVEKK